MNSKKILVIGAGGHARVVSDIIESAPEWKISCYIDEHSQEPTFLGKPVLRGVDEALSQYPDVKHAAIAIGSNSARKRWYEILVSHGYQLPALKHTTALTSPSATIGEATVLAAFSFVGPNCKVGTGCIINTSALLEHDSSLGSFSQLSPRSTVCGGSEIGESVLLGPSSLVEKMSVVPNGTQLKPNTAFDAKHCQDL